MAATAEKSKPAASHLTYDEMILAAIDVLGGKYGLDKSAIINFIEATYADSLGERYTEEISDTLTKLKDNGELVLVRDLFMKPDAISSPERKRGRPKKSKPTLPPEEAPPTPRPRGRPPKPKDFQATAVKSAGGTPRPRGRPPKPKVSHAAAVKSADGISRRRGRPPKKHRPVVSVTPSAGENKGKAAAVSGVKRGRGRPPKVKPAAADAVLV